jgi:hypothetical protein
MILGKKEKFCRMKIIEIYKETLLCGNKVVLMILMMRDYKIIKIVREL